MEVKFSRKGVRMRKVKVTALLCASVACCPRSVVCCDVVNVHVCVCIFIYAGSLLHKCLK